MDIFELVIIAVGVSMDAFAVSVCKGLSVQRLKSSHVLKTSLWFGGFQALMPLAGYFLGVSFADFVSEVDHWIAFGLLGIIGANMIKESFEADSCQSPDFSFRTMLALAVATSIDALAVGVSLAFLKVDIWRSVLLIGVTTALFSGTGIWVGNVFGCRYKSVSECVGGIILVAMGIRILVTHLWA